MHAEQGVTSARSRAKDERGKNMTSLQTNVTSLFAQEQLNQNNNFESNTIRAVDVRLSHQQRGRRRRRPRGREPVAGQRHRVATGRHQRRQRHQHPADHGWRSEQHFQPSGPLADLGHRIGQRNLRRQPHHAEQRIHLGAGRNHASGRQHRFGVGRHHFQHRHHRFVAVQHHAAGGLHRRRRHRHRNR